MQRKHNYKFSRMRRRGITKIYSIKCNCVIYVLFPVFDAPFYSLQAFKLALSASPLAFKKKKKKIAKTKRFLADR